ncbi:MAG: hypothetical protein JWM04_722 [Verrucomicrobiales bacterium]|nr:hypothetical protein [Verrucomicrobiales bacterium]
MGDTRRLSYPQNSWRNVAIFISVWAGDVASEISVFFWKVEVKLDSTGGVLEAGWTEA